MNKKVKPIKERLDVLLVSKGFFNSRENAKRHIMEGIVLVDNVPVDKAGTKVNVDSEIRIKGDIMPYVGRGGFKLEKALSAFSLDIRDKIMADIGASTGGFTDCALQHGAAKVYAIDVGTNQLDWKLRSDPRVIDLEKTNIKQVTADMLGEQVDFVATDISFISVTKIIPAVRLILKDGGALVILIKPQFEAGREKVGKGGIVKNPAVHEEVILSTLAAFESSGLYACDLTWSPIKGGSGNIEFLAYLRQDPPQLRITGEHIHEIVAKAHQALEKKDENRHIS